MAYVLFNRRAHLQRLPVLCTIVCRRRQTNQTVNVTRENIAFFKEMIFLFFFIDPIPKQNIWHWGDPSDQQHCTWHTSITAPPLFEVYNGVECWLHHYLLFFVWPCSLARSCRRCCCRSAAREGELQGRFGS